MPIKQPETQSTGLNMTPMIDIVFNLVTFFMLTLDMSHKDLAALDLPRAWSGIEDKPPSTTGGPVEDTTRFTINLEADGDIYFQGKTFKLTDPNPANQELALENLRTELRKLTGNPKMRYPDGSSKVMVLLRGDRTSKWKYIQWIMQVCADPTIKIWQIHFAVEHPKENE